MLLVVAYIFSLVITFIYSTESFVLCAHKIPKLHSSFTYCDSPTQLNSSNDSNEVDQHQYFSPNVKLSESEIVNKETQNVPSDAINEYSFFDEATILVRAGSGGQGASTYKKGIKGQNAQPDGGEGGKGGDILLICDPSLNTLAGLTKAWRPNSFGGGGAAAVSVTGTYRPMSFRAENGQDGMRQFKNGRFGNDVNIRVPPGTVVQEEVDVYDIDPETGEKVLIRTDTIDIGVVSTKENEQKLIVARGGAGGEGSGLTGYKTGRGVRRTRSPPIGGERKRLKLTLKIVADVALVGVPNCGKSTFLAAVTRAKPKIANYPFTTVIPNLGVWVPPSSYDHSETQGSGSDGLALCDVPGLIAGAAEGIGLGHAFLRHVERCHVILHLIDATSNDPIADYKMVNQEIMRYGNGKLAQMPQIVVVNKVDVWEEGSGEDWEKGLKTKFDRDALETKLKEAMPHTRLMWMSAKEKEGVDDLMSRMNAFVKKVKSTNEAAVFAPQSSVSQSSS